MNVQPPVVRRGYGVPLVAIHGNGVDHRLLLALDDSLAASGSWERIYLDLPGFGRTPPLTDPGGLPELADWVVEAVRTIVGGEPFALLANSLGGLLARHVVTQFSNLVLGLALIAPVVDPDAARRVRPLQSVAERDETLLGSLAPADREEFMSIAVRQTRESWEGFQRHALPGIRAADPDAMERLSRRYFLSNLPEAVFGGPTLIVTGRQDQIVGYEDQFGLLDQYPRATYVAIDGAGHNVHLEQPGLVGAAVEDWARRVATTTDGGPVEWRFSR